jgi:hypothetical protein
MKKLSDRWMYYSGLLTMHGVGFEDLKHISDLIDADERGGLPLKIGDEAWVIRRYQGTAHAKKGIVTEMFYTQKMELCVVVGKLARGKIGEKVFLTQEECEAEIWLRGSSYEGQT